MSFLPIINSSDVEAVKKLSLSERNDLLEKINRADPHSILVPPLVPNLSLIQADSDNTTTEIQHVYEEKKITSNSADEEKIITFNNKNITELLLGQLPHENFDAEYLRLIKSDIEQAQAHLDDLPEVDRRGLTLTTLRHFHCGYLSDWVLTKSRAELVCGLYINKDTGENKNLPPPSPRIIIPTAGNLHFNAVATSSARQSLDKRFWKQHAGKMTLFFDTDTKLDSDTIFIVEGEIDAISIWQASGGKIAVVAILGCDNWKRTLLPKLPDLRGKRLILLLDADAAGNKAAKRLLNELLQRGIPAVRKSLFDALRKDEQNYFGHKVDANDLLKTRGDEYLNQLLVKIIDSSSSDLKALAVKINQPNPFAEDSEPDIPVSPTRKSARQFSTIKPSDDQNEIRLILENFVHAKNLSRDEWCSVGMILKRYSFEFADFDEWSREDSRYDSNDCKVQWNSFNLLAREFPRLYRRRDESRFFVDDKKCN